MSQTVSFVNISDALHEYQRAVERWAQLKADTATAAAEITRAEQRLRDTISLRG